MIATAGSASSATRASGGVGVVEVVERQLLALQLRGAAARPDRHATGRVKRGALMRILAVAQELRRVPASTIRSGNASPVSRASQSAIAAS